LQNPDCLPRETHYGWARLTVTRQAYHFQALLAGYAYETIANTPILAGQTSADPAAAPDANGGQTFTGTVMQQGDKYVLQSESGKVYDIDHQDQVKKFEGKRVRVHGTLDASGKMIHIQ
jgi:hypothetical protein